METDTIERTEEKKERLLVDIRVRGYGLTAYPRTLYNGDLPDGIECNGNASVLLNKREAAKLKHAIDKFLGVI